MSMDGSRKITVELTVDEYNRIEKDRELIKKYSRYFRQKYRGLYYIQMKVEAARLLKRRGIKTRIIGEAVYGSPDRHDVVSTQLNHFVDHPFRQEVLDNMEYWIKNGLYPKTVITHRRRSWSDRGDVVNEYDKTYQLVNAYNLK